MDFNIRKGEFVYITGHSGAGKSTLLSLVLRRITPTEGSVFILGQDLRDLRTRKLPPLAPPDGDGVSKPPPAH